MGRTCRRVNEIKLTPIGCRCVNEIELTPIGVRLYGSGCVHEGPFPGAVDDLEGVALGHRELVRLRLQGNAKHRKKEGVSSVRPR